MEVHSTQLWNPLSHPSHCPVATSSPPWPTLALMCRGVHFINHFATKGMGFQSSISDINWVLSFFFFLEILSLHDQSLLVYLRVSFNNNAPVTSFWMCQDLGLSISNQFYVT